MKKQILFSLIFVLLINFVSASIDIRIDADEKFGIGEQIKFDYTFISSEDEEITYTPRIECIKGYKSFLLDIRLNLIKDIPITKTYTDLEITDELESQECLAIINMHSPLIKTKEEIFKIVTKTGFSFAIKVCEDSDCLKESNIFEKNERVYLNYFSGTENPTITATLTYPDKRTEQIDFPTAVSLAQIGTYEIEVIALKEGYKTREVKKQFAIIEEQADIKTVSESDLSEFSIGEDEKEKEKTKTFLSLGLIILLILGLIIAILIIVYLIFRKK